MLEIVSGVEAPKIAADFDISASTTCCGDAELAGALSHKNVSLIDAYPLINNHKPRDMPFGPMHWCQPIITMHHMSVEEVNDLWQFEQSRLDPKVSFVSLLYVTTLSGPSIRHSSLCLPHKANRSTINLAHYYEGTTSL
jgi:hypothetical protein